MHVSALIWAADLQEDRQSEQSYEPPRRPNENRSVGADFVFNISGASRPWSVRRSARQHQISEKVQSLFRGGVDHRDRHLRVPRADPVDAVDRLASSTTLLLRQPLLDRLPDQAVVFFVAAITRKLAYDAVQKGAAAHPDLAIEEGKRIEQTLRGGTTRHGQAPRPFTPPPEGSPRVSSGPEHLQPRRRAGRRPGGGCPAQLGQIRADIERQRQELSQSVEALRGRVTELTDSRRQVPRAPAREIDHRGRPGRLRRQRADHAAPGRRRRWRSSGAPAVGPDPATPSRPGPTCSPVTGPTSVTDTGSQPNTWRTSSTTCGPSSDRRSAGPPSAGAGGWRAGANSTIRWNAHRRRAYPLDRPHLLLQVRIGFISSADSEPRLRGADPPAPCATTPACRSRTSSSAPRGRRSTAACAPR